ncbi:hypothetical protein BDV23DRAFT_119612 [Aspergillus alliaceus]|uniref:Uncharacterized protein n=1 Tax=Petromyces alliaceus TaxID=209559 RepID=A0A5N7C1B0_PETAA|nr:hypothetical protein BDV23DRAFT_119612 [Aspergillus alliaceus]
MDYRPILPTVMLCRCCFFFFCFVFLRISPQPKQTLTPFHRLPAHLKNYKTEMNSPNASFAQLCDPGTGITRLMNREDRVVAKTNK